MKHTRLVPTIAASIGVVALLAGCTTGAEKSGPAASGGSATTGSSAASIQFVNPLPNYPAWKTIGDCMATQAKALGVPFTQSGPTGQSVDPTTMISQVQQAIANKKSAIITFPASDAFGPLLQQAQAAKIVTATMYGSGTADSGADINVGVDFEKLGATYVSAIAKLPGTKKVGLVAASDTGFGKAWMDGFRAAAKQAGDIEVVGAVYTGDDSSKALGQTSALLTAHGDITVVATHMGTVTQGAVSAIKAKGLTGKVAFVGNGPDNGGQAALDAGSEQSMLVQGLCGAGKDAVTAVAKRLKSGDTTSATVEQLAVGTRMATKDELPALLKDGWR